MPTLALSDRRIHFTLDGEDGQPVLVLLNSLGTTLAMWDAQIADFTPHFRVLRHDLQGHGGSSVPEEPCTLAGLANDAVALLDHLGIARAHFCGLSLGAMIGLHMAVDHPERVAKLVVCNTSGHTASPAFWQDRIDLVLREGTPAISSGVMQRFFSPDFSDRNPEVVSRYRRVLDATPARGYAACCAAIRDMDFRPVLSAITAPTCVIAGLRDQAATPAQSRAIADGITGSRYVELDAAHISSIEVPQVFSDTVLSFLLSRDEHEPVQ